MDSKYVKRRYFSIQQPGSYSGLSGFFKNSKYSNIKEVKEILSSLHTYNAHFPSRKKFKRRPIIVATSNYLWQSDIIDYKKYKRKNKGYGYILLTVDCFSKKIRLQAMKTKSASDVKESLQKIFKTYKETPSMLMTDRDRAYYSKPVKDFLSNHGVHLYSTHSKLKAQVAERYIRTVKTKIERIFTHTKNHDWVSVLAAVQDSINSTYNTSIGMPPNDVNSKTESIVFHNLFHKYVTQDDPKLKFKVGDLVKIAKTKLLFQVQRLCFLKCIVISFPFLFQKGYEANYSQETFKVSEVKKIKPVTIYMLEDMNNEKLDAGFYAEELLKVTNSLNTDE